RLLPGRPAGARERRPVRPAPPLPRRDQAQLPARLPAPGAASGLRPGVAAAHRRRPLDAPPLRRPHTPRPRPPLPASRPPHRRPRPLQRNIPDPSPHTAPPCLLAFPPAGSHPRGEPHRSELAVTTALSLGNAVYEMGQQVGLVTNAGDAADRLRLE